MYAMARLVLRHEDSLSIAASENGYMLFIKANGPASILPGLYQAGQEWKKKKEEDPSSLKLPLRVILFQLMIRELIDRLKKLGNQEILKQAVEAKLCCVNKMFCYVQWDEKEKKRTPRSDRAPIPYATLLESLTELLKLAAAPYVIQRYHSTRELTESIKSEVLPWMLHIGNRVEEAQRAWALLDSLTHNAVWHLIRASETRPNGPQCFGRCGSEDGQQAVRTSFQFLLCAQHPACTALGQRLCQCRTFSVWCRAAQHHRVVAEATQAG